MVSAFMPIFSDGPKRDAKELREFGVADVVRCQSDRGNLGWVQRRSADAFARANYGAEDAL